MAIKFREIKKYISRVVRVSICFEDGHYDNYILPSDIPEGKYDDLYVFGIGMTDVEFPLDIYAQPKEFPQRISRKEGFFVGCGLEIVLHEEPREFERVNDESLTFGDLRNYLQICGNFSLVTKDDWEEERYEFRCQIPEKYDHMYVYGIGIEDNPEKMINLPDACLVDFSSNKMMRIVLSDTPRD